MICDRLVVVAGGDHVQDLLPLFLSLRRNVPRELPIKVWTDQPEEVARIGFLASLNNARVSVREVTAEELAGHAEQAGRVKRHDAYWRPDWIGVKLEALAVECQENQGQGVLLLLLPA